MGKRKRQTNGIEKDSHIVQECEGSRAQANPREQSRKSEKERREIRGWGLRICPGREGRRTRRLQD